MKGLPAETDFVVLGAGIAALRAAIELASAGRVLVLAKKQIDSGSEHVLSDEDDISLHVQDTLTAGEGLCIPEAVKTLVDEAPERIDELIGWGKHLDRSGTKLTFENDAHSHSRILHAQGESTRGEIFRVLHAKARSLKNISLREFQFCTELEVEADRVIGVSLIDENGLPAHVAFSALLLATGGLGQLYRNTTNPEVATADGVAMAYRAGAEISDIEFVQFHPTSFFVKKAPRFLLSCDLLDEGGYLRNIELDRFMGKYHPQGELAPHDVLTRAIMHEMELSHIKDPYVYLDVTHLKASQIHRDFPRVYATCLKYNVDLTEDLIPACPAAHYAMGGVRTDRNGKTNVASLYAAGEGAATGVHGANRLPGNSILESLLYGARAGKAMREELKLKRPHQSESATRKAALQNGPVDAGLEQLIGQIQDIMWKDAGVVRIRSGMAGAIKALEALLPRVANPHTRRAWEAANLHATALLVLRAALAREESRGAHYRIDCPLRDDKKFLKHSAIKGETLRFA
jgi:L-aspartate oxidase